MKLGVHDVEVKLLRGFTTSKFCWSGELGSYLCMELG